MIAFIGALLAGGGGFLLIVGLAFGFAPGLLAKLIAIAYPPKDPRRAEMIAEIYTIPYKERPLWVFEQAERALTEGIPARVRSLRRSNDHYLKVTVESHTYKFPYRTGLVGGRYFSIPTSHDQRRRWPWAPTRNLRIRVRGDRYLAINLSRNNVRVGWIDARRSSLSEIDHDLRVTVWDSARE